MPAGGLDHENHSSAKYSSITASSLIQFPCFSLSIITEAIVKSDQPSCIWNRKTIS